MVLVDQSSFGVEKSSRETDGYTALYNKDLEPGDTITGEVFLSDLEDYEGDDGSRSRRMFLVITDHEMEEKWVIGFWNPKEIDEEDRPKKIYGKKGGKLYNLIDNILSGLFPDAVKPQTAGYHSVVFDAFRDGVNSKILSVTAVAVAPTHRLATNSNIEITKVVPVVSGE